jgi:hypothetical protein
MSELYAKESKNARSAASVRVHDAPRLRRRRGAAAVLAMNMMQNLARLSYEGGSVFGQWHTINANGPIAVETETKLTAVVFVRDPRLPPIDTCTGSSSSSNRRHHRGGTGGEERVGREKLVALLKQGNRCS